MKITRKHPAFFLGGSLVGPLGGIVLLPFLWQKLTPADYGLLATAEFIMAFGAALIGLQQESSLNRLYCEWKEDERGRNISTLMTINVFAIIIIGSLLIVLFNYFGGIFLPKDVSQHRDIIMLFLVYLILTKQRGILNAYLRVTGRSLEFLLYNFFAVSVQIALIAKYVFMEDLRLLGYVIAVLITESIIAFSILIYVYAKAGFYFDFLTARNSLKFSIPLIPAAIFSSSSMVVERSVLLAYVPLSDLGVYAICQRVASVVQLANNSIKMLFAPKAFEMVANNEDRIVLSKYRNKYFIFILLFSTATLPSMAILTLFAGAPEYQKAEIYFPFFVLIGLCTATYPYFCSGAYFSKNTHLSSYPPLVELIAFAFLALVIGGVFLLNGVIFSKLAAALLFLVSGYILSQRTFYIPMVIDRKINAAIICFFVLFFQLLLFPIDKVFK